MRKINKGLEPKEWTHYRMTPGVKYQAIPELKESLLKEQGYICAYCMRRIPHIDKNSNEDSRIDHIACRADHEDDELKYGNMVICCPGAINNDFHCDKKKGKNAISFTPFDQHFIATLRYKSGNGRIESSNPVWNKEMQEVLNLNNKQLMGNRLQVIDGIIAKLNKRKSWKKSDLEKELAAWDNMDENGQFKPYNGIVVWYLQKKMKSITLHSVKK